MRRDSPASGWGYLPLAGECPQFTEDHEAFRQLARIYAGTSEVMKVIIAKSLGL